MAPGTVSTSSAGAQNWPFLEILAARGSLIGRAGDVKQVVAPGGDVDVVVVLEAMLGVVLVGVIRFLFSCRLRFF